MTSRFAGLDRLQQSCSACRQFTARDNQTSLDLSSFEWLDGL